MQEEEQNRLFESLGRIEANQKALKDDFNRRVSAIETDQRYERRMKWVHTVVIVPALAALHAVANKYGLNI